MITIIKRHFPKTKAKWKMYLKVFIPIVLGSILFALNGVIDNFMVGHIEQGQSALGAINSWTNILIGWFVATASAGSVLVGQFYFAKKYDVAKEISRYRFYLSIIPAILLAIIAWTAPDILTKTFLHKLPSHPSASNIRAYNLTLENARIYSKVIAIQWILISLTFNLGNQLREIGFGHYTMLWGIGTLTANITLNSLLMYVFHMGVDGAAWASVAGRIVALSSGVSIFIIKKIKIRFNPFTIFKTSWDVRKLFWKRAIYILSIFTVTFFIIFRNSIYSLGFGPGSLGIGVGALSILSLTSAIINVFMTTFNALTSMSSRFVGSELGNGNLEQAKINGDELKGFMTLISLLSSILMAIFSLLIPYMSFLSETKFQNSIITFDGAAQLNQVKNAILVIALFYPIWIWFSASYRIGNAGGKGSWFAIIDWVITGLQLLWLLLIVTLIVPGWNYAEQNFWISYIIFFLSDLLKLIGQEFVYYQYKWLNVLTKIEVKTQEAKARDLSENSSINRRS